MEQLLEVTQGRRECRRREKKDKSPADIERVKIKCGEKDALLVSLHLTWSRV